MTEIAVVDHGAGNLVSIAQGLAATGARPRIITAPSGLGGADAVVLPGVGAGGPAMARLEAAGFVDALPRVDVPLLGICVGMQVLFEGSDEDDSPGLAMLRGRVRVLDAAPRLPHIGWNEIEKGRDDPLLDGLESGATFYYVHSYAPDTADPGTVVARTAYGRSFPAVVRRGTVWGVQFHPERSGRNGLAVLANFVAIAKASRRERRDDAA